MVIIRFLRTGKKNQAFFRVVATDKRNPAKAGRFLEILGFYNPLTKEKSLKADRIKYWISKGAQTSDTVHNLLIREGVIQGKKISKHRPSKKKEEPAEEKKAEEKQEEKKDEPERKKESTSEVKPEEKKEEIKPEEVKEEAKAEEPAGAPEPEEKKEPKKEEKEIDK